jgi:hypothetical protein
VLGLSHKKKGQYFALDPETGQIYWRSEGSRGENAALVVVGDSILVLEGDGKLLVLSRSATSFAPAHEHRVAESPTFAHPVPVEDGLLIKDESSLSLFSGAPATSARHESGGLAERGR